VMWDGSQLGGVTVLFSIMLPESNHLIPRNYYAFSR
jgi:hypothetical protein